VRARFNHYKVRCEAAVAPTAVRTLRKWLPSVVTFIRHDPVENSNSLPSTGYGLAAQRLPCKLQLLADPDRFRVEGRRLNVARRSRPCIANPIFSVPLLISGSSGSWALGALMSTFSLVLAASAKLRCFSTGSFAIALDGALLGCGVFLIEEFGASDGIRER